MNRVGVEGREEKTLACDSDIREWEGYCVGDGGHDG